MSDLFIVRTMALLSTSALNPLRFSPGPLGGGLCEGGGAAAAAPGFDIPAGGPLGGAAGGPGGFMPALGGGPGIAPGGGRGGTGPEDISFLLHMYIWTRVSKNG